MNFKCHSIESSTDLVEEGTFVLELDELRVVIVAIKPRTISVSQRGRNRKANTHKVLDWMQETICRVRGF